MRTVLLEEVINFTKGKKPALIDDVGGGEKRPYILIENFNGQYTAYTSDKKTPTCNKEDTLIVCDGARTGLCATGLEGYIGSTLAAISTKNPDILLPKYLFYYLRSKAIRVREMARGAAIPHLDKSFFLNQKITLPSLESQNKSIQALNAAENIISFRNQSLQTIMELKKSIFYQMFGDTVSNECIWPKENFGDIVVNLDGKRKPIKSADRAKRAGVFPYYGASGVIDYIDDFIFDGTYLLIAEDGANLLSRSTPLAFQATGKFWVNNHAHIVSPTEKVELIYLEYYLNNRGFNDVVTGSAQPKLNQSNLNKIKVPIPPIELQKKFARLTTELLSTADKQKEGLIKAEELLKSLLNSCFSHQPFTVGA